MKAGWCIKAQFRVQTCFVQTVFSERKYAAAARVAELIWSWCCLREFSLNSQPLLLILSACGIIAPGLLTPLTETWPRRAMSCERLSRNARGVWVAGESLSAQHALPSSAGLLLIVTMMTAAIITMINAITSPLLTLLPSPADAQGCVNVSCGVFYRRHTAQVVLLAIISSSN